jgi:hypothetical protein
MADAEDLKSQNRAPYSLPGILLSTSAFTCKWLRRQFLRHMALEVNGHKFPRRIHGVAAGGGAEPLPPVVFGVCVCCEDQNL